MEKLEKKQFNIFIKDILSYLRKYIDTSNIYKNYQETEYILTSDKVSYIDLEDGSSYKLVLSDGSGETMIPTLIDENKDKFYFGKQICSVKNSSYSKETLKNIMFHELMHVGARHNYIYDDYDICTKTGIYSSRHMKNEKEHEYEYLNEALTEFIAKFIYDDLYEENYKIVWPHEDRLFCSIYEKGYFMIAFLLYDYFKANPKELFEIYFNNNVDLLDDVLRKNTKYTLETLDNLLNLFKTRDDEEINKYYYELIEDIYYNNPIENMEIVDEYNL